MSDVVRAGPRSAARPFSVETGDPTDIFTTYHFPYGSETIIAYF